MRIILFVLLFVHFIQTGIAQQNVAINATGSLPDASAQLDISSTNKGILIPRMTSMQRVTIASPATGLLVFDTNTNGFWFYNGTTWTNLTASSGAWSLSGNSGSNPATNYIGTSDNADLRFKINATHAGLLSANGNISWGLRSGNNNSTAYSNIAIGIDALKINTIRSNMVAIGDSALFNNGAGVTQSDQAINNIAIGSKSLFANTTGSYNTAEGTQTLYSNSIGNYNTANGFQSLLTNTTGSWNTASGLQALFSNTSGNYNTATAVDALHFNTTGQYSTAMGYQALYYNTTGSWNTAHGLQALFANTTGNSNTAVAVDALRANTTGSGNTAIGYQGLFSNTTGILNSAIGIRALFFNTTGFSNIAIGTDALKLNTVRNNLVALGDSALFNNGTGVSESYHATGNTAVGSKTLFGNTSGYYNTGTGSMVLYNNSSGNENTAMGALALNANTTGYDNSAYGLYALGSNTSGNYNTSIGGNTLLTNSTGNYNTAVGYYSGVNSSNLTNATAIGASARVDCSNCLVLGSVAGSGGSTDVKVGIGTTLPQQLLSVGAAMNVDQTNVNNGTVNPGLSFGSLSGEAIASKRTAGGNQYGLDFYTNSVNRMSISNSGTVSIGTTTAGSKLLVSGSESTLNGGNAAIQITNTAPGSNNTWYFRTGATGTVTPEGALSIADNGSYKFVLYNNGNAWLEGTLTQNSDSRLKKDIKQLSSSLGSLQKLNGYNYYWKNASMDKDVQFGVVAQEVKQVFPGLVKEQPDGTLSVNYIGLIPVLIESIKEQQQQIEELKKENAEIRIMLKKNN